MSKLRLNLDAARLMESAGIERALRYPVPQAWPEGMPFLEADQPMHVGRALIAKVHPHLVNAKLVYLFREKMSEGGSVVFAKASKVGGKWHYLTKYDFAIDVNFEQWAHLSHEQRVALIDHELCHCGVEDTNEGSRYVMIPHDVEEFGAIVQRWGMWRDSVEAFGRVVARQADLFEKEKGK